MLEVITGCMYSGKSEELIRRLRRCQIAGQEVVAFKSALDNRYSTDIATHPIEGVPNTLKATVVSNVTDLQGYLTDSYTGTNTDVLRNVPLPLNTVVGLDEVQFFDSTLVHLLEEQANKGRRVIVAGLDLDSEGKPFGPIAELLAVADKVTKLTAVCVAESKVWTSKGYVPQKCGEAATRTYRLPDQDSGEQVQVGSAGLYEARCRACWVMGSDLDAVTTNLDTPSPSEKAQAMEEVRKQTGAYMLDAKNSLKACGWDIDQAVDYLRRRGLA